MSDCRSSAVLAAAVAVCVLSCPAAADEPADILIKAAEAARTQTFQGIVIYRDDDRMEAMRVVHRYRDGHESERVTSLNGEQRDIFREDNRVWCVLPKDQMLQMQRPPLKGFLSQLSAERLKELAPMYELRSLGNERVAARDCAGVAIAPRDNLRYGYEVWADKVSGLPLRISMVDSAGRPIEQLMFTQIEYPASIPDQAFTTVLNTAKYKVIPRDLPPPPPPEVSGALPPPAGAPVDDAAMQPQAGAYPGWTFEHLPQGFRVVMHDEGAQIEGLGPSSHTLLSDGLSVISIFKEDNLLDKRHFRGLVHMGALQVYGRMIDGYDVTVVGEAPIETIRMIGDGLRHASEPANTPGALGPDKHPAK
jgi:sigma-E factor negative regulatory protein RseB